MNKWQVFVIFVICCIYFQKHLLSTRFAPPSGLEIPYRKAEFTSIGPLKPLSQISGYTYSESETCLDLKRLSKLILLCLLVFSTYLIISGNPQIHLWITYATVSSCCVMLSYIFQCRSETSIKAQTRVFTYMIKSTKSISAWTSVCETRIHSSRMHLWQTLDVSTGEFPFP